MGSTLTLTKGITLFELIRLLCLYPPELKITLIVKDGIATDLVGHLVCNLCAEQDMFSNELYTDVKILFDNGEPG